MGLNGSVELKICSVLGGPQSSQVLHGSSESVDTVEDVVNTVEDVEHDVPNQDQGEEDEEHEGEHEGNPEAKDIVKYYRLYIYCLLISRYHRELL